MTLSEKWDAGLPVNIKELSEIKGVSYKTALRWAADETFPRVGRLLMKQDFLRWWKQKAQHSDTASHHQPPVGCKPREQRPKSDSQGAWPQKAARLRDAIASHTKP
jgi:hypothetical protein